MICAPDRQFQFPLYQGNSFFALHCLDKGMGHLLCWRAFAERITSPRSAAAGVSTCGAPEHTVIGRSAGSAAVHTTTADLSVIFLAEPLSRLSGHGRLKRSTSGITFYASTGRISLGELEHNHATGGEVVTIAFWTS
jgi:hypothetical protein